MLKREDTKLFNPKTPKENKKEDNIDKILNMMKGMNMGGGRNNFPPKRNDHPFIKNDRYRLQDMPYNTNWKDGNLVNTKETLDPLKRNNHFVDDKPFCVMRLIITSILS